MKCPLRTLLTLLLLGTSTSFGTVPSVDVVATALKTALEIPLKIVQKVATVANSSSNVAANTYDVSSKISAAGVAPETSGTSPTPDIATIQTAQNTAASNNILKNTRDNTREESQTGFSSFWDLADEFHLILSGNYTDLTYAKLEKKFKESLRELRETYTEEWLESTLENFITDMVNCNTPQLDLQLPTFDLDLGFQICDYNEMFSQMKEQTRALSETSWGSMVKVNGMDIDDLIDDPDALKNAIQVTSPGEGHTIALDAFSEMSTNASVQAAIDTDSINQQIATVLNTITKGRMFGDYTLMDLEKDKAKIDAYGTAADIAANQASLKSSAAANEIAAQESRMAQKARDEQTQRHNRAYLRGAAFSGR